MNEIDCVGIVIAGRRRFKCAQSAGHDLMRKAAGRTIFYEESMNDAFTAEYTVTIGDINYGGHLGNDRALVIFHDARLRFLQSLGFSEQDIGRGRGIIMVEAGVRFLQEVFVHDRLEIRVWLTGIEGPRLPFQYEVQRKGDGKTVLAGTTMFLAFDYQARKVVRVPALFLQKYRQVYGEPAT
jgi:acyl-CoA thioester hydrolase